MDHGHCMRKTAPILVTLSFVVVVSPIPCAHADGTAFEEDCRILASAPHRLTGSDNCQQAAEHILGRLNEIGVDVVMTQPFAAMQTRVEQCELRVVGAGSEDVFQLEPMRPNGIIAPVTTTFLDGVQGRIVHGGSGDVADLIHKQVRGAIVVMNYNAGRGWLRAFRLGARAVVFVREQTTEAWHPHFVEAPVNLPRFYYSGRREDLQEGAQATIDCRMRWHQVLGRNVLGLIRGTAPVFGQEKQEMIVVAAKLDSYGEVPRLSPGARGAANCAALLELARKLIRRRPRRHVLFAFFDGQSRGLAGSSAFYRALEKADKDDALFFRSRHGNATVAARRRSLDAELRFLQGLDALLEHAEPLQQDAPMRQALLQRLRETAAESDSQVAQVLYDLRKEASRLVEPGVLSVDAKKQIERIGLQIKQHWQPEKDASSALRRALGRDRTRDLATDLKRRLQSVAESAHHDVRARRQELRRDDEILRGDTALNELVADHLIPLHVSLMLGDTTPSWGMVIGGDSSFRTYRDKPGLYTKIQSTFVRAYRRLHAQNQHPAHFVLATADQTLQTTRMLMPVPKLFHSGEIAGLMGIFNVVLGTCQESLPAEGTPDDTLDRLDMPRVGSQVDQIGRMLFTLGQIDFTPDEQEAPVAADAADEAVADQRGLSMRKTIMAMREYALPQFSDGVPSGARVLGVTGSSAIPNTPVPDAVVQFFARLPTSAAFTQFKPYGHDNFQVMSTDRNGIYGFGPINAEWTDWAYGFVAVFDADQNVVQAYGRNNSENGDGHHLLKRLNTVRCRNGAVFLPPQPWARDHGGVRSILDAADNAAVDKKKAFVRLSDGVAYWYCDRRIERVKLFSLENIVALNTGSVGDEATSADPNGIGFPIGAEGEPISTALRSALDLWRLNESRLAVLRSRDIVDSSLSELHGRAQDLLWAAQDESSSLRAEALAASAFFSSQPIYTRIRAMLDDLVFAVLILLGLSVPFAFAMERLVIGSATFPRQIAWVGVIFALTFSAHYLTHPAFAIANTPTIIFLGFAVVVMAVLVIFIVMRKFEAEIRAFQGMTSTVHTMSISRTGTLIAAMMMGISTMRRRPLRTALTAVTIVLLTYTILCFASFGTRTGVVKLLRGPNPPYRGVWVHDVNWDGLGSDLMDVFEGRFGAAGSVCERRWVQGEPGALLTREDGSQPVALRGVLGFDPTEIEHRSDLAELFGGLDDQAIFFTRAVARRLRVDPGDRVVLKGRRLRVGPLLDASKVAAADDMDGSSILPVDFTSLTAPQMQRNSEMDRMTKASNWQGLPADACVVVSARTAESIGADLHGISIYMDDAARCAELADDVARMLTLVVAATRIDGVHLHVFGTVLAASGLRDLMFPILLGGMVIFGTMLGSISDREREIYTFSAVGLAPRHVATLFFAEALIYSLIGGLGGYLLAQGVTKVTGLLSEYGLVTVPEMNMSSTNTIATILIVMATVLVSAVYPAIKASRSANPGLMRSWRPPAPQGDVLDLVFPFTVSQYDILGAVSFLKEHFDNHSDAGLGRFIAAEARVVRERDDALGLDARVALAPFDLGVSQRFSLRSGPSEIEGINEVKICLERLSGQPRDWRRMTKVFLDELRLQFLLWRSLPNETMESYRDRTQRVLAAGDSQRG